jgi:hypothetical protein
LYLGNWNNILLSKDLWVWEQIQHSIKHITDVDQNNMKLLDEGQF